MWCRGDNLTEMPQLDQTINRIDMDDQQTTRRLRETLQEGLSRLRGRPIEIRELHREFFLDSSSFRTERLHVLLDDDEWLDVFFKDLNPQHQLDVARRIRKVEVHPSHREFQMYRQILSRLHFGTPQLYAFRWDPHRGIFWIFLEDLGDLRLGSVGDFKVWLAAAQWAGRFHGAVRRLPVTETRFLLHYDRTHYERCADRVRGKLPNLDVSKRQLVGRAMLRHEEILP